MNGHPILKLCLILWLGAAVACSPKDSGNETANRCSVGEDEFPVQFSGSWPATPIPLALHDQSGFSQGEVAAFESAVNTWNSFFYRAKGVSVFQIGEGTSLYTSSAPSPQDVLASGLVNGGSFVNPVVVFKQTTWPPNYSDLEIARTTTVLAGNSAFGVFTTGVLELNYESYFLGAKQPDLETIFLHELGHMLGLKHSCGDAGQAGCGGTTGEISLAVMFPGINFNAGSSGNLMVGEVRRSLNSNDQSRASCLY